NTHHVLVQVFCTALGAQLEASVEGCRLDNLSFNSDFKQAFENVAAVRPPQRKIAESGVDVLVTQERPSNSDLGVDFTGTGILPVKVMITNNSKRIYGFKTSAVILQQADGQRIAALPMSEVKQKL